VRQAIKRSLFFGGRFHSAEDRLDMNLSDFLRVIAGTAGQGA